jgi:RNase P subunit RPR2
MGGSRRKTRRRNSERRAHAEEAIAHLSKVLQFGFDQDISVADNAARQMIGIGKKYGIRPEPRLRRLICRSCRLSMIPGNTARVRITPNFITITCLRCNRIIRENRENWS